MEMSEQEEIRHRDERGGIPSSGAPETGFGGGSLYAFPPPILPAIAEEKESRLGNKSMLARASPASACSPARSAELKLP